MRSADNLHVPIVLKLGSLKLLGPLRPAQAYTGIALPLLTLPEEWKESIIVPIHKKGDKTDCNNYRAISLLPTTYEILSNILLSR